MRERSKDDGSVAQGGVIRCREGDAGATKAHGLAALLVRRSERERHARVLRNEGAKLAAGVTAGT